MAGNHGKGRQSDRYDEEVSPTQASRKVQKVAGLADHAFSLVTDHVSGLSSLQFRPQVTLASGQIKSLNSTVAQSLATHLDGQLKTALKENRVPIEDWFPVPELHYDDKTSTGFQGIRDLTKAGNAWLKQHKVTERSVDDLPPAQYSVGSTLFRDISTLLASDVTLQASFNIYRYMQRHRNSEQINALIESKRDDPRVKTLIGMLEKTAQSVEDLHTATTGGEAIKERFTPPGFLDSMESKYTGDETWSALSSYLDQAVALQKPARSSQAQWSKTIADGAGILISDLYHASRELSLWDKRLVTVSCEPEISLCDGTVTEDGSMLEPVESDKASHLRIKREITPDTARWDADNILKDWWEHERPAVPVISIGDMYSSMGDYDDLQEVKDLEDARRDVRIENLGHVQSCKITDRHWNSDIDGEVPTDFDDWSKVERLADGSFKDSLVYSDEAGQPLVRDRIVSDITSPGLQAFYELEADKVT